MSPIQDFKDTRTSAPLLSVNTAWDSPGSSVFDLPIQNPGAPPERPPAPAERSAETPRILHNSSAASCVVISGGTGGNAICSAFADSCYVLPVSDDGGSSSEIIRVLGGPSIGDIRSRLIRLIPSAAPGTPLDSIRTLLSYRLPGHRTDREAREEWREIVEGRSPLWMGIPNDRKETIRGFLVYFESELLKRAHKNFDFRNGSIGNYFLAAAQGFFRSLPSAIFLFSSITNSQAAIFPVVVTNHTVTIAAELENGEKLVGQCEISHPVAQEPSVDVAAAADPWSPMDGMGEVIAQQRQNVMFEHQNKGEFKPLAARISRLYYINAYGIEIHPAPNPDYLQSLRTKDVLVYSCGSLWTSIIPCLALRGVAGAIARSSSLRAKILLLNSKNDRETDGYTAVDYILAIARTLNAQYHKQPYGLGNVNTTYPVSAFITDLVYLRGTSVAINEKQLTAMGVRCTELGHATTKLQFDVESARQAVQTVLGYES